MSDVSDIGSKVCKSAKVDLRWADLRWAAFRGRLRVTERKTCVV